MLERLKSHNKVNDLNLKEYKQFIKEIFNQLLETVKMAYCENCRILVLIVATLKETIILTMIKNCT